MRFVLNNLDERSIIYITEKLHGTSGRYGHVQVEELAGWKCRINNFLTAWGIPGLFTVSKSWQHINGSKNVILERHDPANSWYKTDDFRYAMTKDLVLKKGEVVYFELVGDVAPTETPIMNPQPTDELPELKQQYGPTMCYRYGTAVGTCQLYVYKILQLNEDGLGVELSWPQMMQRCGELGLRHVPLLRGPMTFGSTGVSTFTEWLEFMVKPLMQGPSTLDAGHIREGVVVRLESPRGTEHVKSKSFEFGVLEGYLKLQDDVVDMEEAA